MGFDGPGRLEGRVGSYCAEEAVAALFGVTLERDPDGFGAPDLLGLSVRYATRPWYGLVTHNRDGYYPYVLVVPGERPLEYEVAGWIERPAALALRERGVGMALPGTTDAWVIPRRSLEPVSTLVERKLSRVHSLEG